MKGQDLIGILQLNVMFFAICEIQLNQKREKAPHPPPPKKNWSVHEMFWRTEKAKQWPSSTEYILFHKILADFVEKYFLEVKASHMMLD